VIGIGGSYLGARAVIEALPEEARFPVLFAGNNLSPDYHARLLDALEGTTYALCVISKSGITTEPAIAFRILADGLVNRFGKQEASRRIIAITDPTRGALRSMAQTEGYQTFSIPPDVGGRYSVLSPVGLVPCAAAGIPVRELLSGAADARDRFTRETPENDALRYAIRRTLLFESGTAIEVLSTFNPELHMLCEWWKQLTGESEGKEGKGLFPASTVMTTDLHSLGQYLQQGVRNMLETFLVAREPRRTITVPPTSDDFDGLNYLAGRTMSEINRKAFESTRAAHEAGGLPVMTIELPSVRSETIGALFIFFEMAIAVSGHLLGINPFDQPGVEEYKSRMFTLLGKPGLKR
jgi:glucose-6-phosphate isomerase